MSQHEVGSAFLASLAPFNHQDRAMTSHPAGRGQIQELLLVLINRGATELIIDMTGTAWCDQAGAAAVVRAHLRAAASGAQLRLVVTAEAVRRLLTLRGLDRLIPAYPSVETATATEAPVVPMTPKLGGPHVPQPRKQTEL